MSRGGRPPDPGLGTSRKYEEADPTVKRDTGDPTVTHDAGELPRSKDESKTAIEETGRTGHSDTPEVIERKGDLPDSEIDDTGPR